MMTENDWWSSGLPLTSVSSSSSPSPEHDELAWSAFADWLEENGEEGRASAVRWVRRNQFEPVKRCSYRLKISSNVAESSYSFDWVCIPEYPKPLNHMLPGFLFRLLKKPLTGKETWGAGDTFREYPSRREAFRALIDAITVYLGSFGDGRPPVHLDDFRTADNHKDHKDSSPRDFDYE